MPAQLPPNTPTPDSGPSNDGEARTVEERLAALERQYAALEKKFGALGTEDALKTQTQSTNSSIGVKGGSRGETRTPRRPLPKDFTYDASHEQFCFEQGLDLADELERFKDNARAKRLCYADWAAAFRNWLKNSVQYRSRDQARQPALGARSLGPSPVPPSPPRRSDYMRSEAFAAPLPVKQIPAATRAHGERVQQAVVEHVREKIAEAVEKTPEWEANRRRELQEQAKRLGVEDAFKGQAK